MSLLADELGRRSIGATLTRFDPRQLSFGLGRSLIALAQFMTLAFTPTNDLFQSILGQEDAPACISMNVASAFCVGGDAVPLWARQVIVCAILLVIATGYRPRYTVFVHAWLAYSIAGSIALPDGGDQAARIFCLIFIPIGLADGRRWHWAPANTGGLLQPRLQAVALAGMVILRLQVAMIYLQSSVAKFFVADWANGSAEYYILRDRMFGASGVIRDALAFLTQNPWIAATATWTPILAELALGVLILGPRRWRRWALGLLLVLHVGIIVTMGLWSFALTMIGGVIVAAAIDAKRRSDGPNPQEQLNLAVGAEESSEQTTRNLPEPIK